MTRTFVRTMALVAGFALAACQGGSYGSSAIPQGPGVPAQQSMPEQPSDMPSAPGAQAPAEQAGPELPVAGDGEIPITAANAVHQVCPRPLPGQRQCFALERQDLRANDLNPNATHQGYGPSDLQSAYNIAGGRPSLVAIVDAYGYPKASSDLASYRSSYHLPACTTGNGCLKIRNQTGGTRLPRSNQNWDAEQAVDLDMVSAMCPGCKLLLVEANSDYTTDLYQAVSEAGKLGAVVISSSFGASEYSQCQGGGEKSDPAFSAPGHIYVAAAGDLGGGLRDCGGPQQPCSLSTVVCVGGTHLVRAQNARGWKESVWNELASQACGGSTGCGATGSGCSTIVKKPSWQNDVGCRMRSEADVAAEASVLTPVAVFFSGYGGWTAFGGTSVSTPLIAGVFGRAGNGRNGSGPQNLWAHRSHLYVQTVGSNLYQPISGNCASNTRYICYAAKNYNGPTGLGTPNGLAAF